MCDSFSENHNFVKPNDSRALELMDHAARNVMEEYPDIVLGFGESDEFRSVLNLKISDTIATLKGFLTTRQLPSKKICRSVQPSSGKDNLYVDVTVHGVLRFPLVDIFP